MTTINSIPDEILCMIFQYIAFPLEPSKEAKFLFGVAPFVCQKWRRVVLLMGVRKDVHIGLSMLYERNNLGKAAALIRLYNLKSNELGYGMAHVLHAVCMTHDVNIAEKFRTQFGLSSDNPAIDVKSLFENSCVYGKLEIAQWVDTNFVRYEDEIPLNINVKSTFISVCENGQLKVAQWLKSQYRLLNDIDNKQYIIDAIQEAAIEEHKDVVMWLCDPDYILKEDIISHDYNLLHDIVYTNDILFIEWFIQLYNIQKADLGTTAHDSLLFDACTFTDVDLLVVEWLIQRLGIKSDDAVVMNRVLLTGAIFGQNLECAKWLVDYFKHTQEYIYACAHSVYQHGVFTQQEEMLAWVENICGYVVPPEHIHV